MEIEFAGRNEKIQNKKGERGKGAKITALLFVCLLI